MVLRRVICYAVVFAALALIQSAAHAEEQWRFINLADWHAAEIYVQPRSVISRRWRNESLASASKCSRSNYGGELDHAAR